MRTQGIKTKLIFIGLILLMSTTLWANHEGGKKNNNQKAEVLKLFDQVKDWINVFDESELPLEAWMMKGNYLSDEAIMDQEIPVEAWMTDPSYLFPSNKTTETEEPELEFESWMFVELK